MENNGIQKKHTDAVIYHVRTVVDYFFTNLFKISPSSVATFTK